MKLNKVKYSAIIGMFSLTSFVPLTSAQAQTTVLDNTGLSFDSGDFAADYSNDEIMGTSTTEFASGFTTGSEASVLDSITLDLSGGDGSGFTIALYSDNGSGQPGTLLETLSGSDAPNNTALYTFTSAGTALAANTTYWWLSSETPSVNGGEDGIYLTSGTPSPSAQGWTFGPSFQDNVTTGGMMGDSDSGWINISPGTAQFSVSATLAPEPSTLALSAMAGLGGLMMYRRRSR